MHTDEQLAVIQHSGGHARVSAVAGSGKTTTMVGRVAWLLEEGVEPHRIRVLMFNKSAQEEFALRLRQLDSNRRLPQVQTFHALAYRLCRRLEESGDLPVQKLERSEGVLGSLAGRILREEAGARAQGESLDDFLTFITFVKSGFRSPEDVEAEFFDKDFDFSAAAIFRSFEKQRARLGIRFFDDLLRDVALAFRREPDLAASYGNHLDYLIVDEYQDINEIQQFLLKTLAGTRASVMVVGDVDQCIYEWRGARPDYILRRYSEDFPEPADFALTHTFRFGHSLSLLANHAISRNSRDSRDSQAARQLCISAASCPATVVHRHATSRPSNELARIVRDELAQGHALQDIAILVRLYAMSLAAEAGLLMAGIPYRLEGARTALERDELQGIMAYFDLATGVFPSGNPQADYRSLTAMFSTPNLGLKRRETDSLARLVAQAPADAAMLLRQAAAEDLPKIVREKLQARALLWEELQGETGRLSAADLIRKICFDLELYEDFRFVSHRAETARDKELLVDTLLEFACAGKFTISGFVDFMRKLRARVTANQQRSDAVLITSIHKAKGLEWPVVILPSLVEGQFPFHSERDRLDAGEEEAERRLFYVGITRAREALHLVHPKDPSLEIHLQQGRSRPVANPASGEASRFLFESNASVSAAAGAAIETGAALDLDISEPHILERYFEQAGLRKFDRAG